MPRDAEGGSSPRARGAHRHRRARRLPPGIIPACAGSTPAPQASADGCRDHPRVRGEHNLRRRCRVPHTGSSPRARGALAAGELPADASGIIPACAGSTELGRRRRGLMGIIPACAGSTGPGAVLWRWFRDHPRVRGEHYIPQIDPEQDTGSSPRARGALDSEGETVDTAGIIPACAGSTSSMRGARRAGRDHPRVRGEHRAPLFGDRSRWGSSPRARGARRWFAVADTALGIIPACAGSTPHRRTSRVCLPGIIPACAGSTRFHGPAGRPRDHPRVRGEHLSCVNGPSRLGGSSPRARGARAPGRRTADLGRDHPRVRGEHLAGWGAAESVPGSSPRARGARSTTSAATSSWGIIPACAGSTIRASRRRCSSGDHPRVRGEHTPVRAGTASPVGSSPRARGAQHRPQLARPQVGIIPACAGSTQK